MVERRLGLFDELEIVLPLEKLLLHVVLLERSHKITQRGGFDYHHYLLLWGRVKRIVRYGAAKSKYKEYSN